MRVYWSYHPLKDSNVVSVGNTVQSVGGLLITDTDLESRIDEAAVNVYFSYYADIVEL